ncbi:hypothetical protein Psi01_31310 [Planobispora siamensis]|uniref:Uncharacterized protein n=1 Tax=Planobispora siamensis TaxID=936338 RepID=A0A8J3SD66_9ACTN|nr:hypothetical protein Psi01_31310 [Planobispora siamensis]
MVRAWAGAAVAASAPDVSVTAASRETMRRRRAVEPGGTGWDVFMKALLRERWRPRRPVRGTMTRRAWVTRTIGRGGRLLRGSGPRPRDARGSRRTREADGG